MIFETKNDKEPQILQKFTFLVKEDPMFRQVTYHAIHD
jgi:hypothetical protein